MACREIPIRATAQVIHSAKLEPTCVASVRVRLVLVKPVMPCLDREERGLPKPREGIRPRRLPAPLAHDAVASAP